MVGVKRRRARSPEDKAARRQAVLDQAWRLFQGAPWGALTMTQVAQGVGLSKAALYRYFRTKETLFLAVEEAQLRGWLLELGGRLDALRRPSSAEQVADVLSESLARRPAMARLLALLHVELEQNLEHAEALRFKRALHALLAQLGAQLARAAGLASPKAGLKAALYLHALIIGLWQVSDPPPQLARLLEAGGLEELRVRFRPALKEAAAALLRGLASGRAPARAALATGAAVR
jgi:TetR/AcrR family transcriptional regulator